MTSWSLSAEVDWHTHSSRTDGLDTPDAMADAAVRAGLAGWGLSDHVRRSSDWVDDHVASVRAMRRDDLQIYVGLEAKILDRAGRLDLPERLPALDHVLVADHQFPGVDGPETPGAMRAALTAGRYTAAGIIETLVVATCNGVERSPAPAIVAHLFSLLPKVGLDEADVSDEHRGALAASMLAAGAAVEVNEKWRCPAAATIRHLHAAGVRVVRGSDAHRADEVGRRGYWDEVAATLAPAATV